MLLGERNTSMKYSKLICVLLAGSLAAGTLAGCGQQQGESSQNQNQTQAASSQPQASTQDGAQQEAEQLLADLTGTYQELFPVIFKAQYDQLWLDGAAAVVGEDEASAAVEMLKESVSGTTWGEEAVEAYGDEGGPFYCGWVGGLAELTIDGEDMRISGTDASGKELFSHTYRFCETTGGLYVYETDDADAGDYAYFAFVPDTPDTTYHIEFRYGSDKADLGEWMAGEYAYWMASGIPTDYTQEIVEDAIGLFCDENLAE